MEQLPEWACPDDARFARDLAFLRARGIEPDPADGDAAWTQLVAELDRRGWWLREMGPSRVDGGGYDLVIAKGATGRAVAGATTAPCGLLFALAAAIRADEGAAEPAADEGPAVRRSRGLATRRGRGKEGAVKNRRMLYYSIAIIVLAVLALLLVAA